MFCLFLYFLPVWGGFTSFFMFHVPEAAVESNRQNSSSMEVLSPEKPDFFMCFYRFIRVQNTTQRSVILSHQRVPFSLLLQRNALFERQRGQRFVSCSRCESQPAVSSCHTNQTTNYAEMKLPSAGRLWWDGCGQTKPATTRQEAAVKIQMFRPREAVNVKCPSNKSNPQPDDEPLWICWL